MSAPLEEAASRPDRRAVRSALWASAAAFGCMLVPGCGAAPREAGVRIGDETLKQFQVGVTTEAWLVAVIGEPTSSSAVEGVANTRVFRYSLGEADGVALFGSAPIKNTAVIYFVITDGVVTRYWADRATEHTLLGSPVEKNGGEKQSR